MKTYIIAMALEGQAVTFNRYNYKTEEYINSQYQNVRPASISRLTHLANNLTTPADRWDTRNPWRPVFLINGWAAVK